MIETERSGDPGVAAWVEERAPFGMFSTDSKLSVTGWNSWLESHSGRTRQEVIGRDLLDLYPELVDRKMDRYFSVETVEKLGLVLDGQKLIMTNIGNVAYSDSLKLQDENGNIIDKRTGLEPGENMSIILYTVFDEGQQTFQVLNTGENFTVEITDNRNIGNKLGDFFSGITGQAIRSSGSGTSNAPFLLLIGLIFGMLIYASFI